MPIRLPSILVGLERPARGRASAGPDECSATGVGLGEPTAIAAAPGSTSLYAGSEDDTAVTPLARAGDGRLSTLPCIQGPPATVCPTTTDGLIGSPNAVAVSPDGAQVYAVSSQNIATGAIAFLNRAADGTLEQWRLSDSDEHRLWHRRHGAGVTRRHRRLAGWRERLCGHRPGFVRGFGGDDRELRPRRRRHPHPARLHRQPGQQHLRRRQHHAGPGGGRRRGRPAPTAPASTPAPARPTRSC